MMISFVKMHGLGNDFMVLDTLSQTIDLNQLDIPTLADRHLGIGFDQLLVISKSKRVDAYCSIYNADGSESEQCGNGLRCIARYLHEQKKVASSALSIETKAGIFPILIHDYEHITVSLGTPLIKVPLLNFALTTQTLPISILETGNPHAIVRVDSIDNIPIEKWASEIANSTHFTHGANVGFLQIINRQQARLRTLERGAGETNACGSNACAAAVAGITNHWLDPEVRMECKLGALTISWAGEGKPVQMTGPAAQVFDGSFFLET